MLERMREKFFGNRRKKIIAGALATGITSVGVYTDFKQQELNRLNSQFDHAFNIEELPLDRKLKELIGTTNYSGDVYEGISKKAPSISGLLRANAGVGLIHLYSPEMGTVESARDYVKNLRSLNKKPFLISADIEGGLVNHLKLTQLDLRKFGLPERMFQLRENEYNFYLNKYNGDKSKVRSPLTHPLPSQEWLGREYDKLITDNERMVFKKMVSEYGSTIAKICDYIGINIVFGPNLDMVDDIDGSKPDELNDRSYGEDHKLVADLGISYIQGFKSVSTVIPVAKHFIGNALSEKDPHRDASKVSIPRSSGAVLPYRDALRSSSNMGVMTSVTSNQLYGQPNIPTVYSTGALDSLKKRMGASPDIVVTDDLKMTSSSTFIKNMLERRLKEGGKFEGDVEALSVYAALATGNDLALIKNIAGREDKIAKKIAEYMNSGINLQNLPNSTLNEAKVNELVRRVFELKVKVGLLTKQKIGNKEYYIMDPRIYGLNNSESLYNSFYSNQWPWTRRGATPETSQPNILNQFWKAAHNFTLSFSRINLPFLDPSNLYNKGKKGGHQSEIIVIDKSVKRLWVYDLKTGKAKISYDVAIGKGGLNDRRFVGDHTTPEGVYTYVQGRDSDSWKKFKGSDMPAEYGGLTGGMLVLAGQWHPEIAIHGTSDPKNLGEVSNGCVRVPNKDVHELLKSIPLGTLVLITK